MGLSVVCACVGSLFCDEVIGALSTLAIMSLRKRELVSLPYLCCGCLCSVPLPHDVVGWSAVCDCGISWSCVGSLFCDEVIGALSTLAIMSLRKRELVSLPYLCCGCLWSVPLPHDVVGWSAVCDCGISWSYLHTVWESSSICLF